MKILINSTTIENINTFISNPDLTAHDKISALFGKTIESLDTGSDPRPFLDALGVCPGDTIAIEQMTDIIRELNNPHIRITSPLLGELDSRMSQLDNESGVFFLERPSGVEAGKYEKFAVFKVGHKRAQMETMVRQAAYLLNLPHAISGMFAVLGEVPRAILRETTEDLWNGKRKVFGEVADLESSSSDSDSSTDSDSPLILQGPIQRASTPTTDAEKSHSDSDDIFTFDHDEHEQSNIWSSSDTGENESSSESHSDLNTSFTSTEGVEFVGAKQTEIEWPSTDSDESSSESSDDSPPCSPILPTPLLEGIPLSGGLDEEMGTIVGILQPFQVDHDITLFEFTKMTMLAMAIGLRDGKSDGNKAGIMVDTEDSLHIRIDPVWTKEGAQEVPTALQLCYLDGEPRAEMRLEHTDVLRLAEIVGNWNMTKIIQQFKKIKIVFEDALSESRPIGTDGLDAAGNPSFIEDAIPHPINGNLNHLDPTVNPKRKALLDSQLEALNIRLSRIRDYVLTHARHNTGDFHINGLFAAVDLHGGGYLESIRRSVSTPEFVSLDFLQVIDSNSHTIMAQYSPSKVFTDSSLRTFSPPPSPTIRHPEFPPSLPDRWWQNPPTTTRNTASSSSSSVPIGEQTE